MNMGKRGPVPKPSALRRLEGKPTNPNEPKPKVTRNAKPPAWMDEIGKHEWRRVVRELEKIGMLTKLDVSALETYCHSYSCFVRCAEVINQHGMTMKSKNGYPITLPHVNIQISMANAIKSFCQEFGLTPSSRSRMSLPSGKGNEEIDEMERLLAQTQPDLRVVDGGRR